MNLEALKEPVTKEEVAAFKSNYQTSRSGSLRYYDISIAIGVAIGFAGIAYVAMLEPAIAPLAILIAATIAIGIPVALYSMYISGRRRIKTARRIERFATGNGWTYTYAPPDVSYPGMMFTAGRNYEFRNIVRSDNFEVGQCTFVVGSGRYERKYSYGYMVMSLDRALPHMVLDGKSNNTHFFGINTTNLLDNFAKDQTVSLEGDFDKYYTLYAPKEYGVDVRYVFTPDLMHGLIEESDDIDIEIMDKQIYVYFSQFDMGNEVFWEKVDRLRTILQGKLVDQTSRYRDDKTFDGSVTPRGLRLRKKVSILAVIFAILYLLLYTVKIIQNVTNS